MSATRVVLDSGDKWYRLLDVPDRGLVLEVVVGTIGLYTAYLTLNATERASYARDGVAFLDALAADVVRREGSYRAEGRTTTTPP